MTTPPFKPATQLGQDFAREVERHLAKAYQEFQKQTRIEYVSKNNQDHRLGAVRQFCKFLCDGSPVVNGNNPRPPRP